MCCSTDAGGYGNGRESMAGSCTWIAHLAAHKLIEIVSHRHRDLLVSLSQLDVGYRLAPLVQGSLPSLELTSAPDGMFVSEDVKIV